MHLNQDNPSTIFKEDQSLFVLLEVPEVSHVEDLEQYSEAFIKAIIEAEFISASEFDAVASDAFRRANLPLSFSVACIFLKESTAYLKTYGLGAVYLKRGGKTVPLVRQGAFASGKIEEKDDMGLIIGDQNPYEYKKNSVYISFETEENPLPDDDSVEQQTVVEDKVQEPLQEAEGEPVAQPSRVVRRSKGTDLTQIIRSRLKGKTAIVVGAIIIVGVLLIMNVVRSYTSKTAQEDRANIENGREVITQKLEQAEDVVGLNAGRAVALLAETKKDLKKLENSLHGSHKKEIEEITKQIEETEKKLLQKNVKQADEFIDLGLEEKGATGTTMWRYDDKVVIINPMGAVYIMSLEKKSLEARSPSGLSGSSLAGLDETSVYLFKKGTGIIKLESEDSKPKTVIKQDKEWGSITDLQVYNKNLYLLDSAKGQIYKYVPTEDGFASSSAYFKSGAYAKNAVSFAIDQSVFVAQTTLLTKYTSGLQDGFAPQYPDKEPKITRVVTGPDVDDVYIWDKANASVIILSKTGDYKKTIESAILSKATSVEVYNEAAYALQGPKIYKVSLK